MSKITQTVLDPTKEVARMSISDEHELPLYYDKDGKRITYIEQEVDYKPEYDFETSSINHWWYKNQSDIYRDVHHKVKTFRSRSTFGKYAKAIFWIQLDKRLLRFL